MIIRCTGCKEQFEQKRCERVCPNHNHKKKYDWRNYGVFYMRNLRKNAENPIYQFFRIIDDELELNGILGKKKKSIKVLRKYEKLSELL